MEHIHPDLSTARVGSRLAIVPRVPNPRLSFLCLALGVLALSAILGASPVRAAIGTVTTITSVDPEPSVVGQTVIVQYAVVPVDGSGTPTGTVTVTDGTQSCTGTVESGQCSLIFTSAGAVTLTAVYSGDANFDGSTSAPVPHQVNPAATVTTIVSDQPDPSAVGEPVTVVYSVTVVAPGSGIPTGTVTVTDGVISCTGTVASGECLLVFTSEGGRTLTAVYSGDSNFLGSVSPGEQHQVGAPPMGACCLATGECRITSEPDCAAAGGVYQGNGVSCEPNPCSPTPAQERTWGRIKSRYR